MDGGATPNSRKTVRPTARGLHLSPPMTQYDVSFGARSDLEPESQFPSRQPVCLQDPLPSKKRHQQAPTHSPPQLTMTRPSKEIHNHGSDALIPSPYIFLPRIFGVGDNRTQPPPTLDTRTVPGTSVIPKP